MPKDFCYNVDTTIQKNKEVSHMLLSSIDVAIFCHSRGELDWSGKQARPGVRWLAGRRYTKTPRL